MMKLGGKREILSKKGHWEIGLAKFQCNDFWIPPNPRPGLRPWRDGVALLYSDFRLALSTLYPFLIAVTGLVIVRPSCVVG